LRRWRDRRRAGPARAPHGGGLPGVRRAVRAAVVPALPAAADRQPDRGGVAPGGSGGGADRRARPQLRALTGPAPPRPAPGGGDVGDTALLPLLAAQAASR